MTYVLNANCLDAIRDLPSNSVDAVVTDPPYGIALLGSRTPWDKVLPDPAIWAECVRVLKPGGHIVVFSFDRLYHRIAIQIEDAGFETRHMLGWIFHTAMPKNRNLKMDADRLQLSGADSLLGKGTALRPSIEPIYMGRKPLGDLTVAESMLTHGTGGIEVDACRIAGDRWPPNIMLDEKSVHVVNAVQHGASAFYMCPKVDGGERDVGLDAFDLINPLDIIGRKEGSAGANNGRAGIRSGERRNTHPTVKPISLMRWLVRMVTPMGGLVLDPFSGSGSTGCAAVLEGRTFQGFELSPEYTDIANARIRYWATGIGTKPADVNTSELTMLDL